jgi:hypothetical protein
MDLSQDDLDELLVHEAEKLFVKRQPLNEYTIVSLIRLARRAVEQGRTAVMGE